MTTYSKDPDASLQYGFDWSPWLNDGETILSHEIEATTGITVETSSATTTAVTVWLSGGTAGDRYRVTCRITTSAGQIDDRSFTVSVRDR